MIAYLNLNDEENTIGIRLGNFVFKFPDDIKYEIFNVPGSYAGFNVCDQQYEYEVLDGLMGLRLLITGITLYTTDVRDLPFHTGTMHFLPEFIKVSTVEQEIEKVADKIAKIARDYK